MKALSYVSKHNDMFVFKIKDCLGITEERRLGTSTGQRGELKANRFSSTKNTRRDQILDLFLVVDKLFKNNLIHFFLIKIEHRLAETLTTVTRKNYLKLKNSPKTSACLL